MILNSMKKIPLWRGCPEGGGGIYRVILEK
jgi:hypothetical protein